MQWNQSRKKPELGGKKVTCPKKKMCDRNAFSSKKLILKDWLKSLYYRQFSWF